MRTRHILLAILDTEIGNAQRVKVPNGYATSVWMIALSLNLSLFAVGSLTGMHTQSCFPSDLRILLL